MSCWKRKESIRGMELKVGFIALRLRFMDYYGSYHLVVSKCPLLLNSSSRLFLTRTTTTTTYICFVPKDLAIFSIRGKKSMWLKLLSRGTH